jgi:hypothetical protein
VCSLFSDHLGNLITSSDHSGTHDILYFRLKLSDHLGNLIISSDHSGINDIPHFRLKQLFR